MSTRRKGAVLTPTLKDPWNHKELNLGFPIANGACYHCTMVPIEKAGFEPTSATAKKYRFTHKLFLIQHEQGIEPPLTPLQGALDASPATHAEQGRNRTSHGLRRLCYKQLPNLQSPCP